MRPASRIIATVFLGSSLSLIPGRSDLKRDAAGPILDRNHLDVNGESGRRGTGLCESSPYDIILKFEPDTSGELRAEILGANQCWVVRSCDLGDFQLVRIPQGATPARMIERFQQYPEVVYAEPDYYVSTTFVPDDEFYAFQWNLYNDVTEGIRMPAAWDIQRGDPNVIVAVLDTGVAYEDFGVFKQAPDLADTPFVPGFDFVNEDAHPNDDHGHGTHVTGTIAQSTDNGLGVAGVAFGCSIMPVKVLDDRGSGDHFTVARGILFAVDHGASIINMSLGAPGDSRTLRDAVAQAYRRGVTVVCAAGNDFLDGNPVIYPAAYDDFCIAVGAIRYDLARAPYSSTGAYVAVVAPGGDVRVDQNGDGFGDGILQQTFAVEPNAFAYWFLQGTSMAAPHVSGLAALLASGRLSQPDSIREAIEQTARDLGPLGWDQEYGWGMIDARAALEYRITGDLDADNMAAVWDR